jgi:hypothetical protein
MEINETQAVLPKKRHPLFKWILVAGITLVSNLFLNYALDAFYPSPKYEAFCPTKQVNEAILTKNACISVGGQWNEQSYSSPYAPGNVKIAPVPPSEKVQGYCNANYTCQNQLNDAQKIYDRNVFIVLIIAGTAFLIGSIFASAVEAVALGFSFAGVLSLIIGTMRYWSSMDERVRVIVLGLALAALIWVGIKKFKD